MKMKKFRYLWFQIILCIFCMTLFLRELEEDSDEIESIASGINSLLFQRGRNLIFVLPMIQTDSRLNSAQSYGMLITESRKVSPPRKTDRLINIYRCP